MANCSVAAHRRAVAPLCSSPPHCALCGRLLPTLFVIGSLKTGTTSLWSHLVDHTEGVVLSGGTTHKGAVSRKEKDFFGDPDQWKLGRRWYERIYPPCPAKSSSRAAAVAIDATPAYHVFHAAPANMASFFGPANAARLRLVWMLREPVGKFWSYFWELKAYGGEWDKVGFAEWVAPKLAATRACLAAAPASPLWPPSLPAPPPHKSCAPHLDHGLYHPQLLRWLEFFDPSQLLLVSFTGYTARPAEVVRDVLLHAGVGAPSPTAPPRASRRRAPTSATRARRGARCRAAGTTSCSRCTRRLSSGSTPSSPHAPSPSRRATTAARASSTRRRPPTRRRRRAAQRGAPPRRAARRPAAARRASAAAGRGTPARRVCGAAARGRLPARAPAASRAFCPGSCAVASAGPQYV